MTDRGIKRIIGRHMKKDFLYRWAEKIWEWMRKKGGRGKWYSKQVKKDLEKLYPFAGAQKEREHYIQKIRLCLLLCVAGGFLAAGLSIYGRLQPLVKDNRIHRPGYGGSAQSIPVEVHADGEKSYEFELQVGERIYSREQLGQLYESAAEELERVILGENESLEHVERDLKLVGELSGYPFQIAWESGDYNLIDSQGKLQGGELPEEGTPVGLNAIFAYEDFRAEYLFYAQLYPRTLTEEQRNRQSILEAVESAERESREEEIFCLPAEFEGKKLLWQSRQNGTWLIALLGAVGAAVLIYFLRDQELKKEIKRRERQMLLTYPEMVSKLSIYLGAGMTLRAAWEKICADYEKRGDDRGRNPVYEEMNIACQEMRSGIAEMRAYERFGRRCDIQLYSKFSALLTQNLKKGSTKLGPLLKEESRRAFEERKNAARKAGEEAGTKLLFPMMMMLCVVMVIILLPAFMTF